MGPVAIEPDWTRVGPISALPTVMVFLESRTDPRSPPAEVIVQVAPAEAVNALAGRSRLE